MDSLRRKPPNKTMAFRLSEEHISQKSGPAKQLPAVVVENNSFDTRRIAKPAKKSGADRKNFSSFFRVLFGIASILIGVSLCFFGYFSWKIGGATRTMQITPTPKTPIADTVSGATSLLAPFFGSSQTLLPGEQDGRINILLLGKANEKTAGQKLTDTIMIASLDLRRKKIALLSLPRDLFVRIPGTSVSTKLNALYQIDKKSETAATTIKTAISAITGLPIHAFAVLDYDGFIRIVDILGGISVYVERDLFDPRYPGPNYSYETFEIQKGWQDLDGETALKYARERHSDPEGDFGRAKRQQALLSAIKQKAFSMRTLFDPRVLSDIIEALGKHIRTDLSERELLRLIALGYEFDTKNIESVVVDAWKKESLLKVSHVPVGNVSMFILLPRTGDWNEIRDLAENIFDLDRLNARKEAIKSEKARIVVTNKSDSPTLEHRVAQLLAENLGLQKTRTAPPLSSIETDKDENNRNRDRSMILLREGASVIATADEITKKFSLNATGSNQFFSPETFPNADIVLILGNDLANRLSFEEDTLEDIQNSENDLDYQQRLDAALLQNNNQ